MVMVIVAVEVVDTFPELVDVVAGCDETVSGVT